METRIFQTNLKCASCVAKLAPVLDSDPRVASWSASVNDQHKLLTISGKDVGLDFAKSALRKAGFEVLDEIGGTVEPLVSPWYKTYFPVLLILAYLVVFVAVSQVNAGDSSWMKAMRNFMGAFFVAFSFFKLLDLPRFADAYAAYDIAAMRLRAYGYAYPFIELGLGVAYLAAFGGLVTDIITFAVMSLSTVGVVRSILKKQTIRCACLGTVFNLPMSKITLVEDLSMVAMAGAALVRAGVMR
jgi:hypothetical protein